LWRNPITRFSLIGSAAFWMIAALMRIAFLAWLTINMPFIKEAQQPMIVGLTAIGIVIGSLLAPKLFEVRTFYKAAYVGIVLVVVIVIATFAPNLYVLIPMLLAIGAFGGLYVVPMNAALQETGTPLVGSGKVIAIQNFFENVMMIGSVGLLLAYSRGLLQTTIETVMLIGAGALFVIVIYLFRQFRYVKSENQ
jgi:LPLT family lysophospholipid transporter-like MFS transporter